MYHPLIRQLADETPPCQGGEMLDIKFLLLFSRRSTPAQRGGGGNSINSCTTPSSASWRMRPLPPVGGQALVKEGKCLIMNKICFLFVNPPDEVLHLGHTALVDQVTVVRLPFSNLTVYRG